MTRRTSRTTRTRPLEVELDALEVRLLLEAINERYGYDLRGYAPKAMLRRVRAALEKSGFLHLGELQHQILRDRELFARVIDDLTLPVSELFRDPTFFQTFRTNVVPLLRTYPLPKIWHAGCATGEEVYSTAIVLAEEGLYSRCQIYATDINVRALDQAKAGVYADKHLPNFAANYEAAGGVSDITGYFTAAYERIAIRESLRKNVLFFQHDLVSDHVFAEVHVLFCRNVLLYFGENLRERVLAKLAESLCPGGFLGLGHTERLPSSGAGARFARLPGVDPFYRLVA